MNPLDQYAVLGHPITHSLSPRIHGLFAAQTGDTLSYVALDTPAEHFSQHLTEFRAAGGRGVNCTLPLKELAFRAAQQVTPRAAQAQAVNTLVWQNDGVLLGDNTDGDGLLRDLQDNLGITLAGAAVLLLGAGGAARGVLGPLLAAAPARLMVANRTAQRAVQLANEFASWGPLTGGGYAQLSGQSFDLIINATTASLAGELPPLPDHLLRPGGGCYDMMYGAQPTPLLRWAADQGAGRCADGIGMLVEQAAAAFELWRGIRPQTAPVIQLLRGGHDG